MKKIATVETYTLSCLSAELTLRIGIHSGPVTAGVLRGQKARYVGRHTLLDSQQIMNRITQLCPTFIDFNSLATQ